MSTFGNSTICLILGVSLAVFTGCEDLDPGLHSGQTQLLTGKFPSERFGADVALLEDVNGDGFADVLIGAPGNEQGGTDSGAAYIFLGGVAGPSSVANAVILGGPGDELGWQVADLGDVNDDGLSDFALAAAGSGREGSPNRETVFVFFGNSDGILVTADQKEDGVRFAETADVIIQSVQTNSTGSIPNISSAGDLDHDGHLDVVVASESENRVRIFLSASLFPTSPRILYSQADVTIQGPASSSFGRAVAAAGNVDGVNHGKATRFGDDLLIGDQSAVYLFLGQAGFPRGVIASSEADQKYTGEENEGFGSALAGIGDFDGDSLGDFAVGAPLSGAGRVSVYFGQFVTGPSPIGFAVFNGENDGDSFGASVSGSLPNPVSGRVMLAVGGSKSGFSGSESGSVYLFSSALFADDASLRGLSADAGFADLIFRNPFRGAISGTEFGGSIDSGLDLNGDASGDLVAAGPQAGTAGAEEGQVFIAY